MRKGLKNKRLFSMFCFVGFAFDEYVEKEQRNVLNIAALSEIGRDKSDKPVTHWSIYFNIGLCISCGIFLLALFQAI